MAIPVSRTPGAKAAGTTSAVSVPLPANIAVGDITILVAETDPTGTVTITVTGGGTWTAFAGTPVTIASGSRLYAWWRRHASGNTAPSVQANVDHVCAGCTAYGGCVSDGDPVHMSATGTEAASDTTFQFITGLTTTVADCICICICTSSADSNTGQFTAMTNALLSSMAEKMDYETTSGHGGGFAFDQGGLAIAGAMGTFAATLSAAWPKAYIAFALKPPVPMQLAGSGASVSAASGIDQIARSLAGAGAGASAVNAVASIARGLAGMAESPFSATGVMTVQRVLAGIVDCLSAVVGFLQVQAGAVYIYFAGEAGAISATLGALQIVRVFVGTVISMSATAATATLRHGLAGIVAAQVVGSSTITLARCLVGGLIPMTEGAGVLVVGRRVAGAVIAVSSSMGLLHLVAAGQVLLSGSVAAVCAASSSMNVLRRFGAAVAGVCMDFGSTHVARSLSGAAQSLSGLFWSFVRPSEPKDTGEADYVNGDLAPLILMQVQLWNLRPWQLCPMRFTKRTD